MLLKMPITEFTNRIFKAGERTGRVLERAENRPWILWFQHDAKRDEDTMELEAAHREAVRAFEDLFTYLKGRLSE